MLKTLGICFLLFVVLVNAGGLLLGEPAGPYIGAAVGIVVGAFVYGRREGFVRAKAP